MGEVLQELIATKGGLAILALLSPTIGMAIFGFLWLKLMQKTSVKSLPPLPVTSTVQAIGQGLVMREEYDGMLSSMRAEQRLLAGAISEISERLARIEERQEMQSERRSKERRK